MLSFVDQRFSALTSDCLTKAGWHPGRNVPFPPDLAAELRAAGHELLPSARGFLAEFGGLTVAHRHLKSADRLDHFVIDGLRAARGRDPAWIRDYERRTRERALTPIGEASGGYLIMCMAPGGTVYGGYDDVLLKFGLTGDDTLEALCTGRQYSEIA